MSRARHAVALLLLAVPLLGACAYGHVREVLRAQFASELNCPEVKMTKRALWYAHEGPDQYKISGCGTIRTYTCPKHQGLVSYDEPPCTYVEGDTDAPKINKPAPADTGGDAVSGGDVEDSGGDEDVEGGEEGDTGDEEAGDDEDL